MRFCEGLPERGVRPLTGDERARLVLERRRARRRLALAILGLGAPFAVAVTALLAAVALGGPESAWASALGAGTTVVALLVGVPLALLSLRDAARGLHRTREDLRAAEVVQFADARRSLAVLPRSGRALAEDGRILAALRPVHHGEAVPVPLDRPTYALAAADIPEEARALGWVRRALAGDERAEARAHAARFSRPPRLLLALTVFFLAMLAFHLQQRAVPAGRALPPSGLVWAAALGFGWFTWLRRRSVARRLLSDAEDGWVLRATAGERAGTEVLPASGLVWAEGAAPAGWRLSR